MDKCKAVSYY